MNDFWLLAFILVGALNIGAWIFVLGMKIYLWWYDKQPYKHPIILLFEDEKEVMTDD